MSSFAEVKCANGFVGVGDRIAFPGGKRGQAMATVTSVVQRSTQLGGGVQTSVRVYADRDDAPRWSRGSVFRNPLNIVVLEKRVDIKARERLSEAMKDELLKSVVTQGSFFGRGISA